MNKSDAVRLEIIYSLIEQMTHNTDSRRKALSHLITNLYQLYDVQEHEQQKKLTDEWEEALNE